MISICCSTQNSGNWKPVAPDVFSIIRKIWSLLSVTDVVETWDDLYFELASWQEKNKFLWLLSVCPIFWRCWVQGTASSDKPLLFQNSLKFLPVCMFWISKFLGVNRGANVGSFSPVLIFWNLSFWFYWVNISSHKNLIPQPFKITWILKNAKIKYLDFEVNMCTYKYKFFLSLVYVVYLVYHFLT